MRDGKKRWDKLATLDTFVEGYGALGVAVIFGVDELMDMGRTCVNVIGNCLATCVIARCEGEFDDDRARVFGTPEESAYELAIPVQPRRIPAREAPSVQ